MFSQIKSVVEYAEFKHQLRRVMIDNIKPKGAAQLRLEEVIKANRDIADACERLAAVLAVRPELDEDVCRAFGIPLPIEKK